MKHKILWIFLLLINSSIGIHRASAQDFASLGSEWTYHGIQLSYTDDVAYEYLYRYKSIQADTLPDKIVRTVSYDHCHQLIEVGPIPTYTTRDTVSGTLQFYEKNDTVWVHNQVFHKFTPLYIFNVQEGDTLRLPILEIHQLYPNASPNGDSVFTLLVDSIRTVNYGSVADQTYYVSSYIGDTTGIDWTSVYGPEGLPNPVSNWTNGIAWYGFPGGMVTELYRAKGSYTRLFGGTGEGLLPRRFDYHPVNTGPTEAAPRMNRIQCFSNDQVSFVIDKQLGCDTFMWNKPTALSSVEALNSIDIYPNPATNQFMIHADKPFAKNSSFYLVDVLGKTIVTPTRLDQTQEHMVNTTSIVPGVYFIVFEIEGTRYYRKIAIR